MLETILIEEGMAMSNSENKTQRTQHAFLVAWGWFAEYIGLLQRFQTLPLKQKHYHHSPQTKVLEFLVAILGGSAAPAGYQPGRPSLGQRSSGCRSLGSARVGRLQRGEPDAVLA